VAIMTQAPGDGEGPLIVARIQRAEHPALFVFRLSLTFSVPLLLILTMVALLMGEVNLDDVLVLMPMETGCLVSGLLACRYAGS